MAAASPRRPSLARVAPLACCVLWAVPAPAAEPAKAARLVPARGLVAYLEYDGIAAHAPAWKATAARAMLEETPAGAMVDDLTRQLVDRLLKEMPGVKLGAADLLDFRTDLARSGFAVGIHREAEGGSWLTLALPGAARPGPRERFERLARFCLDPAGQADLPVPTRVRGREVRQLVAAGPARPAAAVAPGEAPPKPEAASTPWLAWWFEGDDLLLVNGPAAEGPVAAVLDAIERKAPDASAHPGYRAAAAHGGDLRGFEPDGLLFVEPSAVQDLMVAFGEGGASLPLANPLGSLLSPPGGELEGQLKQLEAAVANLKLGDEVPPAPAAPAPAAPATVAPPGRVEPLTLPPARYAHDDVQYLAPSRADGPKPAPAAPAKLTRVEVPKPPEPPMPPAGAAAIPAPPEEAKAPGARLGLDGVGRIVGRWGFAGKALVSDFRVDLAAPRKGVLAVPTLRMDRLPPIPRRARSFVVGTFEPSGVAGRVGALVSLGGIAARELQAWFEDGVRDYAGLDLGRDVLARLGSTWAACTVPPRGEPTGTAAIDLAALIEVRDADGLARSLDAAAARFNAKIRELDRPEAGAKPDPGGDAPILALEPLQAPARGYRLTSPAGLVPWLAGEIRPTVRVGRGYVAFALHPDVAAEALAAESDPEARWRPTGELLGAFEGLPEGLTLLGVGDPAGGTWTRAIPALPAYAQTWVGVLGGLDGQEPADLLGLIGVPKPGGFRIRIAPGRIPKWEDLRAQLFPSVLSASIDDRGLRIVAREAFPLAPFGDGATIDTSIRWGDKGGFKVKRDLSFELKKRIGR